MRRKFFIGLVGGARAVVAVGGVGTHLLSGTESTGGLAAGLRRRWAGTTP